MGPFLFDFVYRFSSGEGPTFMSRLRESVAACRQHDTSGATYSDLDLPSLGDEEIGVAYSLKGPPQLQATLAAIRKGDIVLMLGNGSFGRRAKPSEIEALAPKAFDRLRAVLAG